MTTTSRPRRGSLTTRHRPRLLAGQTRLCFSTPTPPFPLCSLSNCSLLWTTTDGRRLAAKRWVFQRCSAEVPWRGKNEGADCSAGGGCRGGDEGVGAGRTGRCRFRSAGGRCRESECVQCDGDGFHAADAASGRSGTVWWRGGRHPCGWPAGCWRGRAMAGPLPVARGRRRPHGLAA